MFLWRCPAKIWLCEWVVQMNQSSSPPNLVAGKQPCHSHEYHYDCSDCLALLRRFDRCPMEFCSASAHALLVLGWGFQTKWCGGGRAGVHLASGKVLPAQFVVDTTGGRSHAVAKFLKDKCGQKVESIKFDIGLNYYTRFFRMPEKVIAFRCQNASQHPCKCWTEICTSCVICR